ncbi:MAG: hypothetical protein U0103_24990 [Candidatus Obscuribacterales bacterium]
MFSHQQRLFNLALAFTLTCGTGLTVPAFAAATGAEIVAGIEKEHILAPGARVNARVDGSNAYLSTYRHTKANDTDLKIDAMLMSRVVMTLDPGISNVTVYFFSNADLTKYKQLTVSSVSVKAFGSGAVGKDELISSLNLISGSTQDAAAKLANALAAGQGTVGHRVESAINGSEVTVSTDLDPDASERDVKYAALQLAEEALQAAPEVKTVKVAFADLSQPGSYRQVVLDVNTVRSLNSAVKNALAPVSVSVHTGGGAATTVTASSDAAMPGPIQDERQKLLDRINALGKNGVGVAPFLAAFKAIEQQVADHVTVDSIADAVHRLSANVDSQEKSYKEAKAKKPTGTGAASVGGGAEPRMPTRTKVGRWAAGLASIGELQPYLIIERTDQYLADIEGKLKAAQLPQKEKDEKYARTMQFFIITLSGKPEKSSELNAMKRKLSAFQAQHPELNYD